MSWGINYSLVHSLFSSWCLWLQKMRQTESPRRKGERGEWKGRAASTWTYFNKRSEPRRRPDAVANTNISCTPASVSAASLSFSRGSNARRVASYFWLPGEATVGGRARGGGHWSVWHDGIGWGIVKSEAWCGGIEGDEPEWGKLTMKSMLTKQRINTTWFYDVESPISHRLILQF
jgi:hypothetical protein